MRIIVDSNFLMSISQVRVNLSIELEVILNSHYELLLPTFVRNELEKLAQGQDKKLKTRNEARFALKLAQKLCHEYPQAHLSTLPVDEQIINLAKEIDAVVATNDKVLRTILKREGIATIYLRGKNRLEMTPS